MQMQGRFSDGDRQSLWQSTDREPTTLYKHRPGVCDEDAVPNICRLLVIAYTLPITNAEAEPSFSLMK